jgi:hypothetical protein
MKLDLYTLPEHLARLALLAFLIRVFIPASPHWLIAIAATTAVASLVALLADELIARKRKARPKKPFIAPP